MSNKSSKINWVKILEVVAQAIIAALTALGVSSCANCLNLLMNKVMIQETFPMIVGGDEIPNERTLLTKVESGLMMSGADAVRFLIVHCSATCCDRDYTMEQMLRDHKARGFRTIGYHFYIRKSGIVTQHHRLLEVGAHARGFNRCSIGICYEGGLDEQGNPADTRTPQQKTALLELLWKLHRLFPAALVAGHRDLPGVKKACPCFDASGEYNSLFH